MTPEIFHTCDQLVSATVNGTYQGIIITLLVGLSLRLLPRSNAATRHAIWLATLLLCATLIPAHCLRGYLVAQGAMGKPGPGIHIGGATEVQTAIVSGPTLTTSQTNLFLGTEDLVALAALLSFP